MSHELHKDFDFHRLTRHILRYRENYGDIELQVFEPVRRADASERFPVLYATDSNSYFGGLANLASALQMRGEVSRFILVGIGYPSDRDAILLRMRDLYTHSARQHYRDILPAIACSPLGGSVTLAQVDATVDASNFLTFCREEIFPFIDATYRTLPDSGTYFGYSAGGFFGLYVLFSASKTFRSYILGSPATSFGGRNFVLPLVEEFIATGEQIDAELYIGVGALEKDDRGLEQFDIVSGSEALVHRLKGQAIPGLMVKTTLFENETHATAWASTFSHGLRCLFANKVPPPFLPAYLR